MPFIKIENFSGSKNKKEVNGDEEDRKEVVENSERVKAE